MYQSYDYIYVSNKFATKFKKRQDSMEPNFMILCRWLICVALSFTKQSNHTGKVGQYVHVIHGPKEHCTACQFRINVHQITIVNVSVHNSV